MTVYPSEQRRALEKIQHAGYTLWGPPCGTRTAGDFPGSLTSLKSLLFRTITSMVVSSRGSCTHRYVRSEMTFLTAGSS